MEAAFNYVCTGGLFCSPLGIVTGVGGPPWPGLRANLLVRRACLKLGAASVRVLLCEDRWCAFYAFGTKGAVYGFLVDSGDSNLILAVGHFDF